LTIEVINLDNLVVYLDPERVDIWRWEGDFPAIKI
jgi:hypothetical protein